MAVELVVLGPQEILPNEGKVEAEAVPIMVALVAQVVAVGKLGAEQVVEVAAQTQAEQVGQAGRVLFISGVFKAVSDGYNRAKGSRFRDSRSYAAG